MTRPNVLFVVFDTARADAFAPYDPQKKTPAFAQLAARGAVHRHAIAPSCWTLPSHAAMFTGELPRSIGMCSLPDGNALLCAPVFALQRERVLAERLRRAGYRTCAVSTNLWVSTRTGLSVGFEEFHDLSGPRVRRMGQKSWKGRLRWYRDALRAKADDGAAAVESFLATWLSERRREPFFLFVNLIECHSPYLPPMPFNDLSSVGRVLAAEDARRYQTLEGVWRACSTDDKPPRRAMERMRHLYGRSIELLDAWLARTLELLDRNALLDDTHIVVTSDHGENFGEGGLIGHGLSLDDRLLRVPLVVAGPGVTPARDEVLSLCALPRMIAEAAGINHPWGVDELDGTAVAQYDPPVPRDDPRAGVLDEWGVNAEGRKRLTEPLTCATDGSLKLLRIGDEERLYDTSIDRLEVAPAAREAPAHLRAALDRAAAREWQPPSDLPPLPESGDIAELEERMRLLGYL